MTEWLNLALDAGIREVDFWDMTLAEVLRALESSMRVSKSQMKAQARMDYTLANLIGYSVGRIHNKANQMPSIYDSYPHLFNEDEDEQAIEERMTERSAINFLEFARAFNKKFEEVGEK